MQLRPMLPLIYTMRPGAHADTNNTRSGARCGLRRFHNAVTFVFHKCKRLASHVSTSQ